MATMKNAWVQWCMVLAPLLAACSGQPDAGGISVRDIGGEWITPESCSRAAGGWVVSDMGCGHTDEACPKESGKVFFVSDDGARKEIGKGFAKPNGVAQDAEGNTWVAAGGSGEIAAIRPDGTIARVTIPNAGLLNDVAVADFYPRTVFVSDSKTGAIYIAYLGDSGVIAVSTYATVGDAPNGLAWTSDGLAVATLGSLTDLTVGGTVRLVRPAQAYGTCAEWHGTAPSGVGGPPHRLLDGIVAGDDGKLYVASIKDGTVEDGNDTTLWRIDVTGSATQVYDVAPLGLTSAADIGRDPKTGDICFPDYAHSAHHPGSPARVVVVSGVR